MKWVNLNFIGELIWTRPTNEQLQHFHTTYFKHAFGKEKNKAFLFYNTVFDKSKSKLNCKAF